MLSVNLRDQLAAGRVLILDGAVGTQLQGMGVPMDNTAWAARALLTHPDTVRHMHAKYVRCDVDIITANTYSSARHNLEPLGLGDLTGELNLRAISLARQAIDRYAEREVYLAGSVSNYGIVTEEEPQESLHRYSRKRSQISETQARENLREQAEILADGGADLLLVESTGSNKQRGWVYEACLATGLPTWLGFRVREDTSDSTIRCGYASQDTFADGFDKMLDLGSPDAVALFHSSVTSINAALPVLRERWNGPIAVYPEAERADYAAPQRDRSVPNTITPEEFCEQAKAWVNEGVQIVGGCCGIDVDYVKPLSLSLPEGTRAPGSRQPD